MNERVKIDNLKWLISEIANTFMLEGKIEKSIIFLFKYLLESNLGINKFPSVLENKYNSFSLLVLNKFGDCLFSVSAFEVQLDFCHWQIQYTV